MAKKKASPATSFLKSGIIFASKLQPSFKKYGTVFGEIILSLTAFLGNILLTISYIFLGVAETSFWLTKILSESGRIGVKYLWSLILQTITYFKKWVFQCTQLISTSFSRVYSWLATLKRFIPRNHQLLPDRLLPKRRIFLPAKLIYFSLGGLTCFVVIVIPYWLITSLSQLPNPKALALRDIPVSTKIYDRNGILLYQIYADENRSLIALAQLPKHLLDATVAIEDRKFYNHMGVDLGGMIRAAWANSSGPVVQGASTVTQQLVKSALLTPERTLSRKVKEIILSLWTERIYSKAQILEMYLNQIPYGGAAYGIEAASEIYFGKQAKDLTLGEAALLAGLPAAPSDYSPFGTHPELVKERQFQVLQAMVKEGYITQFAADQAYKEGLHFAEIKTEIKAPHFVMYVKDYLIKKYGIRLVERGGLEVHTSLDYPTYEKVASLLREGLLKQKDLHVGNGAVMVTNPKTGEVLVMVGSVDYFDQAGDGNVNITLAHRSPGSSIKPLNYALAFDKGLITPSTIIDDSPITFKFAGTEPYSPQNYDNRFHGRVTARVALASSYNIPAIKVLEKNGLANFIQFAQNLGISTFSDPNRYGLALTLGGGEVKMTDMAVAFSAFANGGLKTSLKPVLKVTNYQGNVLEDNTRSSHSDRVLSSRTAFLISSILSDDSARAPTFGAGSYLNIANHHVSVKTGTAETKKDNWTIGYTPSVLTAVWVGNNDNSPMSPYLESGRTGAAAIWNPIMTYLLENKADEPIQTPEDVVAVQVCAINGLLACENCPFIVTEYYTRGSEPKMACRLSREDRERFLHPEVRPDKEKEKDKAKPMPLTH